MKIRTRVKKETSNKEKPLLKNGFALAMVRGVTLADSKFEAGILTLTLKTGLKGENGGEIEKLFFFDVLLTNTKGKFSKLLRTMISLNAITNERALELVKLSDDDEVTKDDVRELAKALRNVDEFYFKTVLKDGKFHIDYDSIVLNVDDVTYEEF